MKLRARDAARWVFRAMMTAIPDGAALPVLTGPLRGARWRKHGPFTGYITGRYEHEVQRAFARHVHPGDTVYDLGAHHGFYTVLGARFAGPRGRVVACEPNDRNADQIEANVAVNRLTDCCAVVRAAVGDRTGTAEFQTFIDPSPTGTLVGRLVGVRAHQDSALEEVERIWSVEATTVDALAGRYGPPRVVKCDVEGAESRVLRGAAHILRAARPVWILSLHNADEEQACSACLEALGYRVTLVAKVMETVVLAVPT
ncbi:MAG TPA: FkbM family methyltransferase [bacterium]|nr:FkbM family methyltransferase [bacterium]